MFKMTVESFISKIEEKLFELAAANTMRDINHNPILQTLKRNLRALSAKAIDVEDEIENLEQSGHKKRKREVENWLEEVKELETEICTLEGEVESERFVSRFLGGNQPAQLKERVVELVEQSRHFGELVLEDRQTRGEELLVPRLVGKAFKKNLKRIWEMLRDDTVTSIGIYGMGGVGKTTLTKHINNILVEKKTQKCVFWVTVSQESSIRILQDKIAHVAGIDLLNGYDEDKRAARLYRALSSLRKNFVLILDDVWRNISLEKLGIPLRVEGSTLIITTRSLQVCHQISCQQVIPVETLDNNEAWELFTDTLGQGVTLSPQVEEIAKSVANSCDGLPLGIITLAATMRGETAINVWRNALEELRKSVMEYDDMKDHVFKVLKYSFDRLNPKHQEQGERNGGYTELQHCFLYCSLYPEDHKIEKAELVRKFISEELVDKRKMRRAQIDQGHTLLNRLVNVCLLESSKNDAGSDCVKMHDLVREMALKITRGKNMVLAGCLLEQIPIEEEYWTKDVEKMSLMENSIKEIPDGMSPNCPKLSTLLLRWNERLKFIANSFFSQMHGLCILDISYTDITELPNSLSDLENLEALILRWCHNLVKVPYLGKLKGLKELDLSHTAIKEVPQGMNKLVNLKFLSMDYAYKLEILPTGLLLKFPYLQCLHLPSQIEAPIIEMEILRNLEGFKGRVNDVADFNGLIGCRPLLKYYIIVRTPEHNSTRFGIGDYNGVTVVGGNCLMEDVAVLAHDAQHLGLENCEGLSKSLLDDFPKFNNPTSLESLRIRNCRGIECILAKNGELESRCTPLGTLEDIELYGLPNFTGLIQVALPTCPQVVFSSLRELDIRVCEKMKNLGLTGSEFPNLESISVQDCLEIEEIIKEGGVVSFPKLKKLTMWDLPKLKHVGTTVCHSIESIIIFGCGALKKLPLYFPIIDEGSSNVSYSPPPALKSIDLLHKEEEWWQSLEWEHPSHKLLLRPFLAFSSF